MADRKRSLSQIGPKVASAQIEQATFSYSIGFRAARGKFSATLEPKKILSQICPNVAAGQIQQGTLSYSIRVRAREKFSSQDSISKRTPTRAS